MPSPFPGMDPYLEDRQWTSVHTALSVEIARQLSDVLPPRYVARPNERIVTATPEAGNAGLEISSSYPDAFVSDTGVSSEAVTAGRVALATPPIRIATIMPEPIPHITVEITDTQERRLVTAIEVLSPTNKRRRPLMSSVHLVEIDLLRSGDRVPVVGSLPPFPYFVFVARAPISVR